MTMTDFTGYILQTSRGVFFLREPKRRRQLRHSCKGLGGFEIDENDKIHKIHPPHIQRRFSIASGFIWYSLDILQVFRRDSSGIS